MFTVLLLLTGLSSSGLARDRSPDTEELFERYSDRVGKIQVLEITSGAKSSIGSGFYVSADGLIVTNYHVIARLIHYPNRYRAEFIDKTGKVFPLSIASVDVLNDLALTRADARPARHFRIQSVRIAQGARLYSLGYPHDIGISIVEGTHNGYLRRSSYKRIHFTGSINPGMSGGPAITASGEVAGINVATAGNQVSFLVPVEAAVRLIEAPRKDEGSDPASFYESLRSQILSHQETFVPDDLMRSGETIRLGTYEMPGKVSPAFNCWADSDGGKKQHYEIVIHQCSTNESIYVSDTHTSGIIRFRHRFITTNDLNPFRFYKLYTDLFSQSANHISGSEDDVARYRCKTDMVEHGGMAFKTVFCMRNYRKLAGLYDVTFKAAVLGSTKSGLETTLVLSGVTFEKALHLTRDYLERIAWKE